MLEIGVHVQETWEVLQTDRASALDVHQTMMPKRRKKLNRAIKIMGKHAERFCQDDKLHCRQTALPLGAGRSGRSPGLEDRVEGSV